MDGTGPMVWIFFRNGLADLMVIRVQHPANRKKESWQIADAHCSFSWCTTQRDKKKLKGYLPRKKVGKLDANPQHCSCRSASTLPLSDVASGLVVLGFFPARIF